MTKNQDQFSAQEIERRREAALKKMLATPPKPHAAKKKARSPKAPRR